MGARVVGRRGRADAVSVAVNSPATESFARLGIYRYDELLELVGAAPQYRVEGLLLEGSINLLVGHSGLGKTPLGITLALSIAAGVPFLARPVRQGPVLYADAESGGAQFTQMVGNISQTLGLPQPPPDFSAWSPNWDRSGSTCGDPAADLFYRVEALKPDVVIVDPLRVFFPNAELKSDEAIKMIQEMRDAKVTWVVTHHLRKTHIEGTVSLERDPHAWFQEAAGSHAIVNQTDSRLGVEGITKAGAELVMSGFVRSVGPVAPIYLQREYRESDDLPMGYRHLSGPDFLNERYREVYAALPSRFQRKHVVRELGGSSESSADLFLRQAQSLGLVHKEEGSFVKGAKRTGEGGGGPIRPVNKGETCSNDPWRSSGGTGEMVESPAPPADLQQQVEEKTVVMTGVN